MTAFMRRNAKALVAFGLTCLGAAVSQGLLHGTAASIVAVITVGAVTAGVYQVPNKK